MCQGKQKAERWILTSGVPFRTSDLLDLDHVRGKHKVWELVLANPPSGSEAIRRFEQRPRRPHGHTVDGLRSAAPLLKPRETIP